MTLVTTLTCFVHVHSLNLLVLLHAHVSGYCLIYPTAHTHTINNANVTHFVRIPRHFRYGIDVNRFFLLIFRYTMQ